MKAWSSYRDQGLAEWRSNRRLRLAALLALAVAGGQVLIHLSESRAGLAQEYRREAALLERLVEASRDEAWPARAVEAEAQLEAMRQSVPEMSSSGLAQAELQTWITGLAQRNGLPAPRVRVETTIDVPGHPELWQVLARLDVEGTDASLAPVLEALAAARPWIQTDLIDIQRTSAGSGGVRLGLVARAYYRRPSEADGDAAPEATGPTPSALQGTLP